MLKGEEIKRRREALGMSQAAFAKAVGLSQQNLSRLENNLAKGSRKVGKIATVLGCSIYDLDPEFSNPEASVKSTPLSVKSTPLSDDATNLIAAVASRMAAKLGFRPTDAQVIQHLLTTSPYRDLGE